MMKRLTDRRGRQYSLTELPEIRNPDVGYLAAILDEARARCVDLICDMTDEAMWRRPAGTAFSAGDLVVHMVWAEYLWLPKIGPHALSDAQITTIEHGNLATLYDESDWRIPVSELVTLCADTRETLMIACLRDAASLDTAISPALPEGKGPKTVQEVLMHVVTSWIYHSGQVGLLTMQNGLDYVWAFE